MASKSEQHQQINENNRKPPEIFDFAYNKSISLTDTLNTRARKPQQCSVHACLGTTMSNSGVESKDPLSLQERLQLVVDFFKSYYTDFKNHGEQGALLDEEP
jgi:hypothetical protein